MLLCLDNYLVLDYYLVVVVQWFGMFVYVYFVDEIVVWFDGLWQVFGCWFVVSYVVKSNFNLVLLGWMWVYLDYLDVFLGGEFVLLQQVGWDLVWISFIGFVKCEVELCRVIIVNVGELVLESLCEVWLVDVIVVELGCVQFVLICFVFDRVLKGFGDQMVGCFSVFGVDVEDVVDILLQIVVLFYLCIIGLYIYLGM